SATVPQNAPLLALNHLDGFGTESDIDIYFTGSVDATTLTPNTVLVFKVASSATTKAVDPTKGATLLAPGTDYSVGLSPGIDSGGEIVTIKPLKPLTPSTVNPSTGTAVPSTYLVVVTTGVKDKNGDAVAPSPDYSTIVAADAPALAAGGDLTKITLTATDPLLPVAQFTLPQLAVAAGAKIPLANVAVTFSFSTAYLGLSLAELSANATATTQPTGTNATGIVDTGETVCDILVASGQLANATACAGVPGSTLTEVFAGTVALPYYLTVPKSGATDAITDSWHNAKGGDTAISTDPSSLLPKATTTQNIIPILVALPKSGGPCTVPAGNAWPTVIFQHGITRNREDMLGIASTLVLGGQPSFCTAVVAIDLPLHGVTDTSDPFYQNQLFAKAAPNLVTGERTFNMDATGKAGATGSSIDGSGQLFINLNSTITSRDNLREGAADLINLAATLPTLSAVTPGVTPTVNTFNTAALFFVGHSLGGIVGTDFLGADTGGHALGGTLRIKGAVLANPGGHIAQLLQDSATFGPLINTELAANGITTHTQSYYDFYSEAQAVVEDGDPANYAAAASQGHLTHMLEVVGGLDKGSPPDQVVPNSATDVLIEQMGITTPVSTLGPSNAIALGAPTLAQFISGDHGSVLSPAAPTGAVAADVTAYAAVTTEMQTEILQLFGAIAAGTPVVTVANNTYLSTTLKK
ncbi:MAG TPA: hypothetical protein VFK21_00080, partial [Gammaproteobacteria bacterium]|nr:hypothetical protein [Gammaproteobacteria bacterium]